MATMDVRRLIPATDLDLLDIVNPQGEDLGQVQNLMVDPETGRVAFLLVSFGGILGLTDKWLAVPMDVLRWDYDARHFVMDVPRETLERAPGLNKDRWKEEFNLAWLEDAYECFGCQPYWAGETRWAARGAVATGAETLIVSAAWFKGHTIKNQAGEDIGKIGDLIVDLQSGYLTYAVVDIDAYEVLKGKKLAIPIEAFSVSPDGKTISFNMDRKKLEGAPVFDLARIHADTDAVAMVYSYFGYNPYWENRDIWRRRGTPVHPMENAPAYRPDLYSVSDVIGNAVYDVYGKDTGKMEDLMIDLQSGFLASAILSRGGIAGVAEKYYPLPLEVLSFDPMKKAFYLAVDRETVEESPAFEKDRLPRIDRQGLIDVYAAYGYTPYWRERQANRVRPSG